MVSNQDQTKIKHWEMFVDSLQHFSVLLLGLDRALYRTLIAKKNFQTSMPSSCWLQHSQFPFITPTSAYDSLQSSTFLTFLSPNRTLIPEETHSKYWSDRSLHGCSIANAWRCSNQAILKQYDISNRIPKPTSHKFSCFRKEIERFNSVRTMYF